MGVKSTDRGSKGFGVNKVLDQHLVNFFNTERVGVSFSFQITGGVELSPGNGYKYNVFTSPGTLSVFSTVPVIIEYLVVAGGGSGGNNDSSTYAGGGGGAGGFRTGTIPLPAGAYPITIGSGGSVVGNGSPSSFHTITSTGGGSGGSPGNRDGSAGGSGGGSGGGAPAGAGASGNAGGYTPPEGNPGGPYNFGTGVGGGGGGAGGAGGLPTAVTGGVGLAAFSGDTGIPASYGTPGPTAGRWFAGGGGGGNQSIPGRPGGLGGAGGGGSSITPTTPTSTSGVVNTGGGGAGAGIIGPPAPVATSGGSGIVIIRYQS